MRPIRQGDYVAYVTYATTDLDFITSDDGPGQEVLEECGGMIFLGHWADANEWELSGSLDESDLDRTDGTRKCWHTVEEFGPGGEPSCEGRFLRVVDELEVLAEALSSPSSDELEASCP